MLPDGAVRVENIWKRFKADHRMLLRDELQRFGDFLKGQRGAGWRWVLRDVCFEIEPGESVGLIGVNGSGKTTLLKLLSKVMFPYAGTVDIGGQVGALISVTGGLHEDLTGRENVYIYGSLLGWKRKQMASHFDEIIDFAEIDKAIDRQVKFYSQGMKMRLAFAIASSLEPDVLLVDEVLAVGDAWFQKKCLDRMRTIVDRGTTIVYVSHDLATVQAICNRTMWMSNGQIVQDGESARVIESYLRSLDDSLEIVAPQGGDVTIRSMKLQGPAGRLASGEAVDATFEIEASAELKATIYFGAGQTPISPAFLVDSDISLVPGTNTIRCILDHLPLPGGSANAWAGIVDRQGRSVLPVQLVARFEVQGPPPQDAPAGVVMGQPIFVSSTWQVPDGLRTPQATSE